MNLASLALLFGPLAVMAQSPIIQRITPQALAPGKATEIVLVGDNLKEATQFWSSFAARVTKSTAAVESDRVTFQVELEATVPHGIGAVRLVGSNGVSAYHLIMVDPIPSVSEGATNASVASAQALSLPVAVDGVCQEMKPDFYRFTARKGQRVCIEVVAQRLGSLLDPRVRLLDAKGRELFTVEDTPGIGADCALEFRAPRAGDYFVELRDTKYEGGPKHRYRLRVGDFERAPFPFLANAIPAVLRGAGLVELKAFDEQEPNDKPAQAVRIPPPARVAGAFAQPDDRDFYEFTVEKDQRLFVRGRTRSLGSPCDLFLQIQDTNGSRIAEASVSGADEGTITNTFKKAGNYRLLVEELNHLGGKDLTYRLEIRPLPPGFALSVETADISASAGGGFEISVKPARRDYDGPIQLKLIGLGPGFAATNDVITAKTNAVKLSVTVPAHLAAGAFHPFVIVGEAQVDGQTVRTRASTLPALRKAFPEMPFPPEALDGLIGLGISAPKK